MARPGHLLPVATALAVPVLSVTGTAWLATPAASAVAGAAIALFGLPHGTLDIELLTRARADGRHRFEQVLLLYVGCAAAMALLWSTQPIAALAVFILVAVRHFAEDWPARDAPFLAHGLALALIAAPVLLHRPAVASIFVALTGTAAAARVADALLIVAPVALAVAAVAIAAMFVDGAQRSAAEATASLAALALLPPAVGFAVYFCVFHSPAHLRDALDRLGWARPRQWLPVVMPVTAAAIGLAALLYRALPTQDVAGRLVAAVFMTLSVVTLPHLAVPMLLDLSRPWRRRRATSISTVR